MWTSHSAFTPIQPLTVLTNLGASVKWSIWLWQDQFLYPQILSLFGKRFYTLPFSIRAFEDEAKARLGVVECAKHELLQPFSVLQEKEGECLWVTPPLLLIFTYSPPHSLSALRRVCSPVQVHSAAHGQRASQNHQRTPGSWALQVGARSPGPRTQGKLMNVCPTASWCTGNGSTVRWCNSL